jgi:ABC-type antimicrobial peptide transport system permease subunit
MSRALIAAVPIGLFLHWLAAGQVTVTVDGVPVAVPAVAVAALVLIAVSAAVVALVVYRIRAERAMLAAWRARKAVAR